MADRTCEDCGKVFKYPKYLRQHQRRTTPCAPILETEDFPEDARDELKAAENESRKCHFCGRVLSSYDAMRRHVRTACKIAPNQKNGGAGMEYLYEHTIRRQEARLVALETLVEQQAGAMATMRGTLVPAKDKTGVVINNVNVDARTFINVFGKERTDHVTPARIREVLEDSLHTNTSAIDVAANMAVLKTAMLVYSDPDHPENLTCYLPNKKTGEVLVHGEGGWEIQPCPLVLSPMAQTCIDTLFEKQPYEDATAFGPLMQELRDNETRYAAGDKLKPVLVRNKDLLQRVLQSLPMTEKRIAEA